MTNNRITQLMEDILQAPFALKMHYYLWYGKYIISFIPNIVLSFKLTIWREKHIILATDARF